MSKTLRALIVVLLVASCGGGQSSAPRDLDNACAIVKQRPGYLKAFRATERKWGVPVHVQMATLYQESKFIAAARPPFRYTLGVIPMGRLSSAFGYSQALDGTWEEYQDGPGGSRARRDDIFDATDFMGWYMAQTVEETGVPITDTRNQYLAYHDGRTGFRRGTWKSKSWLVRIAGEVEARAVMYDTQLRSCRKI